MSEFTFTLDGREVAASEGQTILHVALTHGVAIPHLCHDPRLSPTGACRLCLVEIEGEAGLHTACTRLAMPGMTVRTEQRADPRLPENDDRIPPQRASRRLHDLRCRRRLPASRLRLRVRRGRKAVSFGGAARGGGRLHRRPQGNRLRSLEMRPLPTVREDLCRGGDGRGAHAQGAHHGRAGQHGLRPAAERLHLRNMRPVREHVPHRGLVGTRSVGTRPCQGSQEGADHVPLLRRRLPD